MASNVLILKESLRQNLMSSIMTDDYAHLKNQFTTIKYKRAIYTCMYDYISL